MKTKTLWALFFAVIILSLGFALVTRFWQFGIIDEMYVAEEIRAHINAMSPLQRQVHAWMTGTLDVAYPFAYGALLIGIALRCFDWFGRTALWLAVPSVLVIPVDLIEGFAQIMLLNGGEQFMGLKVLATPIKLVLFLTGLCIAVVGLLLAAVRHFKTGSG